MTDYYGDFPEDATVLIPFNTFTSDDPAISSTITDLADADIKVHKDGGVTQIVTDGATVAIDFDSITGNHLVTVDTSAHADYSTGSDYAVRIEGTTIDGGTINAWIGTFSIENRFNEVTVTSMAANVVTAAAVAAAAIDNATFAADVGSTAYATNIIALAVRKALDELNLDHLAKVADADDVVDNTIIAKLAAKGATADWSDFINTTDSQQAIRDHIGDGTNLTEAGGTGDQLTAINLPNQTMDITGNLSGSVGSVTGAVGSVTGAVGSVTAEVDADVKKMNGNTVNGAGTAGDLWRGA